MKPGGSPVYSFQYVNLDWYFNPEWMYPHLHLPADAAAAAERVRATISWPSEPSPVTAGRGDTDPGTGLHAKRDI